MRRAMSEATLLFSVTAVVVVGLVGWVAFVLAKARTPWTRDRAPSELVAAPAAVAAPAPAEPAAADPAPAETEDKKAPTGVDL